ncbi:MAG: calcium-binding protein [Solirubrobacteraceae bacterium]|jgi:hypothetical protein
MKVSKAYKLVSLTALVVLAICPSASAGIAFSRGGGFGYQEVPPKFGGEAQVNHLSVSVATTTVTFSDPAGIVVGDTSCHYVSEPTVVACSGDPRRGLEIGLGAGNDSVAFHGAGIRADVDGGSGNDVIHGSSIGDVLAGNTGNDRIFGLGGSDLIIGGPGNDVLNGGSGNDRIVGNQGIDLMIGGPGFDHIDGLVRDFARR